MKDEKYLELLAEKYPTYLLAFDKVMKRTSGHRFNMMIMKRDKLDAYCSWLCVERSST